MIPYEISIFIPEGIIIGEDGFTVVPIDSTASKSRKETVKFNQTRYLNYQTVNSSSNKGKSIDYREIKIKNTRLKLSIPQNNYGFGRNSNTWKLKLDSSELPELDFDLLIEVSMSYIFKEFLSNGIRIIDGEFSVYTKLREIYYTTVCSPVLDDEFVPDINRKFAEGKKTTKYIPGHKYILRKDGELFEVLYIGTAKRKVWSISKGCRYTGYDPILKSSKYLFNLGCRLLDRKRIQYENSSTQDVYVFSKVKSFSSYSVDSILYQSVLDDLNYHKLYTTSSIATREFIYYCSKIEMVDVGLVEGWPESYKPDFDAIISSAIRDNIDSLIEPSSDKSINGWQLYSLILSIEDNLDVLTEDQWRKIIKNSNYSLGEYKVESVISGKLSLYGTPAEFLLSGLFLPIETAEKIIRECAS